MDKLTLRPAAATDRKFAYRVKREAFRECVEKVWGWDEAEQRRLHERRFGEQDFRVINLAGVDVGIVAMVLESDCVKVNQIFILPSQQGKGVGRACMELIIDEAEQLGLPVRLRVLKVNPRAWAFFQRLGFVPIGQTETHDIMERAFQELLQGPIRDGEEAIVRADGQQWMVTWHAPDFAPSGRRHGSAGICLTPEGGAVLVSADGDRWDLPAGRPEGSEDWEETLRREVDEEACATVLAARLLGFSRGHCIAGQEKGLVLVRAIWRAEVDLQSWQPRFEIRHRRVVPAAELLSQLTVADGYLPIYRRAMVEAGLA